MIRDSEHKNYDLSGTKFELYAYSTKNDNKDVMIKILKDQIAKEISKVSRVEQQVTDWDLTIILKEGEVTKWSSAVAVKRESICLQLVALLGPVLAGGYEDDVDDGL